MKKIIQSFPKVAFILVLSSWLIYAFKKDITIHFFGVEQLKLDNIGQISKVTGKVLLKRNVIESFTEAMPKEAIANGARIWTQSDSSAIAEFNDGSKIELGANAIIELSQDTNKKGSDASIKMSVFKGDVRPIVVKSALQVFSGGKLSLVAPQEKPLPEATPLPKIVNEVEDQPKIISIKRELKVSVNAPEAIVASASQNEGTLRLSVNNNFGQQVFLETKSLTEKKDNKKFEFIKIEPGDYQYRMEWLSDNFEVLSEDSGKFNIPDLSPPKVVVQQEVPKISALNGVVGWRIFFNAQEKGLTYKLKLICGEQSYLLEPLEVAKDSIFFEWNSPNWNECKGHSQYQLVSKSLRGVEGLSDAKTIDSELIPPEVDLTKGISFVSVLPYDEFLVEISDDQDFNNILFRQKTKPNQPIDFEIDASKNDSVFVRVKGEWKGNLSSFSVAKKYRWVKK